MVLPDPLVGMLPTNAVPDPMVRAVNFWTADAAI
jgi:hypothetical protein